MYITDKVKDEFIQWLKDTGRLEYKSSDVFVNNDGEMKIEKRMAWSMDITPKKWKEFCDITGIDYGGEINLLAIY